MTIRIALAASLAMLVASARAFGADPLAPTAAADATQPAVVKIESLTVIDAGPTHDDPRVGFGIVNLRHGTCYAIAPPSGATVEIGESYTVIPSADVEPPLLAKMKADYPTCAIVYVVGRALH